MAAQAGDMDKLAACYTDDATGFISDLTDQVTGPKAIIDTLERPIHAGFSDFHHMPVIVLANGNKIAVAILAGGTQDGTFMGVPATHKKASVMGFRMITMADGKIKYDAHVTDPSTWMAQLGVAKLPHREPIDFGSLPAQPTVALAKQDQAESDNVAAVKAVCDGFNKHDAAAMLASQADDVVWTDYTSPTDMKGKKAADALMKGVFKAFPDVAGTCDAWGAGDYVVNWIDWTGTNTGTFPGFIKKATGKQVHIHDAEIYQFAGGKVVHYWRFSNGLAFAGQLGLLPKPSAEKTAAPKKKSK